MGIQEIIVAVIGISAFCIAIRRLYKFFSEDKTGCSCCSNSSCQSKKSNKHCSNKMK